ncbi:MAG: DUF2784 domain-containing protein [Deltaproteobacteria bacterium]|nr:DUF2784 domain-containing protein [Deltaproteobacteria bacterium]
MIYQTLANFVIIAHFAFVLFVIFGGVLVLKWRSLAWIHIPAFLWGALAELAGWVCPLTPLEIWLREKGGGLAYRTDFIEYYVLPLLYPAALTRNLQIFLGFLVLSVNLGLYAWTLWKTEQHKRRGKPIPPG